MGVELYFIRSPSGGPPMWKTQASAVDMANPTQEKRPLIPLAAAERLKRALQLEVSYADSVRHISSQ